MPSLVISLSFEKRRLQSWPIKTSKVSPLSLANQKHDFQVRDRIRADAKQTAIAKEETRKEWKEEKEEEEESEFKDFRIQLKKNVRRPRKFNFVEAGKYVKEANQMRMKVKMATLKEKIDVQTRETGIAQVW